MLFVVCTRMSVRRAQADFAKLLTDAPDRLLFSAAAEISTVRNATTELETTLFDGSSSQMVARVQKYLVGVSTACAADAPPAECDADAVAIEELLSADIISQYAGILDHPELERLASLKTSLLNHVQMWLPGAKAIFTTTTDASDADTAVFYDGVLSQPNPYECTCDDDCGSGSESSGVGDQPDQLLAITNSLAAPWTRATQRCIDGLRTKCLADLAHHTLPVLADASNRLNGGDRDAWYNELQALLRLFLLVQPCAHFLHGSCMMQTFV